MLFVKKSTIPAVPIRGVKRELDYLYARRSTIDALIDTLQTYDRCRDRVCCERKRKSA
jgi:hypothetical protein